MAITPLPEAPSRSDPATFPSKGDALLGALAQFVMEANALLATCELKATTNLSLESIADTLAPAGTLRHWPTQIPPAGWLVRDGSELSRTAYAKLFAVIGTTYGAGNGSTTFNLPDDRGLGITGYKSGDNAFGTFGGSLGSKDAVVVAHGHNITDPGHAHSVYDPGHAHPYNGFVGGGGIQTNRNDGSNDDGGSTTGASGTGIGIYGAGTGITIQSTGSAATNANIPPTRVYLPIIKY